MAVNPGRQRRRGEGAQGQDFNVGKEVKATRLITGLGHPAILPLSHWGPRLAAKQGQRVKLAAGEYIVMLGCPKASVLACWSLARAVAATAV